MSAASDHRNVPAVSTPKRTRELMERYGIGAKKSLGQNFLIDQNILQKIVDAAELAPDSGVLEIGPGLGALTEKLAQAAGTVVAVEIDHRLFPALRDVLAPFDNVRLVHGNILEMDLPALFQEHFRGVRDVRVAANLPYYITTPILMKLLESALPLACIVVMVQKEVAERMSAAPGGKDYGSLSIAVQYYCETDVVAHVPKTVFIPAPGVDSAVIRLRMRRNPAVEVRDVRFFFRRRASFVCAAPQNDPQQLAGSVFCQIPRMQAESGGIVAGMRNRSRTARRNADDGGVCRAER